MPAFLSITLRNALHEACHFTVVDNIRSKTVLDEDLAEDASKQVKIAPGVGGTGDISYTPLNHLTIRKISLQDGDTVDMD
ncbi:hypothetical protein DYQ86_12630 [Acidobacteria bacterium AB60]|nr:hypothetical protein DYQ86_12630 [Acidobacteria bacterium AB60]